MSGPATFAFLSETHTIETPADWDRAEWPRLWRYNLHYFDDLAAERAEDRDAWHAALIRRWIDENPPPHGTGWEPYCLSLRIVNWIKWLLAADAHRRGALADAMHHSLAVQARALEAQIEYHLLGNHLWANAKGLVFAGCYFGGDEGARWRSTGERILRRELPEQILADGGHFERSPMYHAIALEDVLDLTQLGHRYARVAAPDLQRALRARVPAMLRWLAVMSHPDGEIALFNDAAWGIGPRLDVLEAYAAALEAGAVRVPLQALEHLEDSGYVRLTVDDAVVLMDVGEVGPDYLPGHAHADTLSIEWSLGPRRILVNGGTSTYVPGPLRSAQRGTGMHNTVVVAGQNSSDVWGGFRTGRRARVGQVHVGREADCVFAGASHDGYRHLPGHPIHHRTVAIRPGLLCVTDRLELRRSVPKRRLPDAGVSIGQAFFRFAGERRDPAVTLESEARGWAWQHDVWYPRFGPGRPATVGRVDLKAGDSHMVRLGWRLPAADPATAF
ncbi:MAG: heparinase II/III family protein [Lautropia sp.]